MNPAPILIAAVVDACERPVLARAARDLATALEAAGRVPSPVTVEFHDSLAAAAAGPVPTFAIASLLPELDGDDPLPAVDTRWRAALAALPAGWPPVLLCTIFRHVDPALGSARCEVLRERLRRLALMAVEISHDTGANVIDFDRTLAHVGARALGSDFRFASDAAIVTGARTAVRCMLALGQDDVIAPEVVERAEASFGAAWDLPAAKRA